MFNKIIIPVLSLILGLSITSNAKESIGKGKNNTVRPTRSGCAQTTATIDLDINNVRALLMNGGDMWWDRSNSNAAYVVPKTGRASSLYAGSLWIGGYDNASGQLRVAAQTYRQGGNDFWSGPLDNTASVDQGTCQEWDRFWKIDASAIQKFTSLFAGKTWLLDSADIKNSIQQAGINNINQVIQTWPAAGNQSAIGAGGSPLSFFPGRNYAPFVDQNKDGKYRWQDGDYPKINGDQYIWWVYNDKGNVKTETGSLGVGLEIQASAFAFSTNDELNNATFYNYRLINRGNSTLDSTFMATWTDADLGNYVDDYIGCDVSRGLGIIYNGDGDDEGPTGYGRNIPMQGVDFFIGPRSKTAAGLDTFLGMSYFTFFNNVSTMPIPNPSQLQHFYNYMTGSTADGNKYTLSCTGFGAGPATNYVFPSAYKECNPCNNTPFDRRFVHSSGPIKLLPGIQNDITIGAIFVSDVGGGCPSFGKLQLADDKAQSLFDLNFELPFGPQAPDVVAKPFDRKLVFYLNNPYGSNNFNQQYGTDAVDSNVYYREKSPEARLAGSVDSLYKFEGYVVYQLANESVTPANIRNKDGSINENKARIVYQCDIRNNITSLYNFAVDPELPNNTYYAPKLMVDGANKGISRFFEITTDAFATGSNRSLVNFKTYRYLVLAYASNKFKAFNQGPPPSGQPNEYRESRTNGRKEPLEIITVIPTPTYDNVYEENKATFGDGIEITKLEGKGNGGLYTELTAESEAKALAGPNYQDRTPTYKAGSGPVKLTITDPSSLKPGDYKITFEVDSAFNFTNVDSTRGLRGNYSNWRIDRSYNGTTETFYSEQNMSVINDQLLIDWGLKTTSAPTKDWGMALSTNQVLRPGDLGNISPNGLISGTITYADASNPWLTGIEDVDGGLDPNNWIRAGVATEAGNTWNNGNFDDFALNCPDSSGSFEEILNGTWAPYNLAARTNPQSSGGKVNVGNELQYVNSPADRPSNKNLFYNIHSVDVVFTNDRSKWTRCSVVEMNIGGKDPINSAYRNPYSQGNISKFNLRAHPSLELNPNSDGSPKYSTTDSGHSWFPGYAINIETGERLNIVFGEDSGDPLNNGMDMIWNPTSRVRPNQSFQEALNWGGHHVVYISNTRYDAYDGGADFIYNNLKGIRNEPAANSPEQVNKRKVWQSMMWTTPAMLAQGRNLLSWQGGIVPSETRVKIRVQKPYTRYVVNGENDGWPVYGFNTDKVLSRRLNDAAHSYSGKLNEIMDNITVVPNPYYAYSQYENNRLDTRVRITNLPENATVTIYSPEGSVVRVIQKSDRANTFVDWDLKNAQGIPISSGMYLLHIKIKTEIGETSRIYKFFGVMRPQDITNY
jgi:hypothetical protein